MAGFTSGLMWADSLLPRKPANERTLRVKRQPAWWIVGAVLGLAYILTLGPGIKFTH